MNATPEYVDKIGAKFIAPISPRTLDRYRAAGMLPFYRVGGRILFKTAEIRAFIEKRRIDPTPEGRSHS